MEKGKIYKVDKGKINIDYYDHYFAFLYDHKDFDYFIGVMLTKCKKYSDNCPMQKHHFKSKDYDDNEYSFQFNNTVFARQLLIKDKTLPINGPFGELTEEGLQFIEETTKDSDPLTWPEAIKKINS